MQHVAAGLAAAGSLRRSPRSAHLSPDLSRPEEQVAAATDSHIRRAADRSSAYAGDYF